MILLINLIVNFIIITVIIINFIMYNDIKKEREKLSNIEFRQKQQIKDIIEIKEILKKQNKEQ